MTSNSCAQYPVDFSAPLGKSTKVHVTRFKGLGEMNPETLLRVLKVDEIDV